MIGTTCAHRVGPSSSHELERFIRIIRCILITALPQSFKKLDHTGSLPILSQVYPHRLRQKTQLMNQRKKPESSRSSRSIKEGRRSFETFCRRCKAPSKLLLGEIIGLGSPCFCGINFGVWIMQGRLLCYRAPRGNFYLRIDDGSEHSNHPCSEIHQS